MGPAYEDPSTRHHLLKHGYCHFRGVFEPTFLEQVARVSEALAVNQTETERLRQRYTGSLIGLDLEPYFSRLIAHPGIGAALASLGYPQSRYMNGYVISKPPGGPALYWHQDWWGWDKPISYEDEPAMLFAMVYLGDTSRANGCLRVIPGSHRKRHRLHDIAKEAHTKATSTISPDDPIFQAGEAECDVPVTLGDLVLGDARVLHATHANESQKRRTVITIWYLPRFDAMPADMRAEVTRQFHFNPHRGGDRNPEWPAEDLARIAHLIPRFDGELTRYRWVQSPDQRLK